MCFAVWPLASAFRSSAVTNTLARTGVIRPDPKDPSPLRIDEVLVRKMVVLFIRDEVAKAGLKRATSSRAFMARELSLPLAGSLTSRSRRNTPATKEVLDAWWSFPQA